jgi:hypothetical protein
MLGLVVFIVSQCTGPSQRPDEAGRAASNAAPATAPVAADEPWPVAAECSAHAELMSRNGVAKPAGFNKDGFLILVDRRWAQMDLEHQRSSATCISHVLAGGQNRWIRRIVFKNQVTGLTYGVMEGSEYEIP